MANKPKVSSHLTSNDFAQMVDLILKGENTKLVMPKAFQHVQICQACEKDLGELLTLLSLDDFEDFFE